ncbi:hypothetical protein CSKR_107637 [Clonorchis sinensis]|uniref:Uncharacterized protein n=1 Tax=Clonorchis sinensis TaxID=79923 RepID=A0A3R7GYY3_CLOSI|nr:hypothetical protein CSKR_107637 [Clonorchis sinensis]
MAQWLEREFTDRKVRGSNPTSASRLPLSRLGQPGSIPSLVLPSGDMAARHRKGATEDRFLLQPPTWHKEGWLDLIPPSLCLFFKDEDNVVCVLQIDKVFTSNYLNTGVFISSSVTRLNPIFIPWKPVYLAAFDVRIQHNKWLLLDSLLDSFCIDVCCLSETRIQNTSIWIELAAPAVFLFLADHFCLHTGRCSLMSRSLFLGLSVGVSPTDTPAYLTTSRSPGSSSTSANSRRSVIADLSGGVITHTCGFRIEDKAHKSVTPTPFPFVIVCAREASNSLMPSSCSNGIRSPEHNPSAKRGSKRTGSANRVNKFPNPSPNKKTQSNTNNGNGHAPRKADTVRTNQSRLDEPSTPKSPVVTSSHAPAPSTLDESPVMISVAKVAGQPPEDASIPSQPDHIVDTPMVQSEPQQANPQTQLILNRPPEMQSPAITQQPFIPLPYNCALPCTIPDCQGCYTQICPTGTMPISTASVSFYPQRPLVTAVSSVASSGPLTSNVTSGSPGGPCYILVGQELEAQRQQQLYATQMALSQMNLNVSLASDCAVGVPLVQTNGYVRDGPVPGSFIQGVSQPNSLQMVPQVRGSNPTSASRLPLSRLGKLGSIPALVQPSGGMTVRHRKGATAEPFTCSVQPMLVVGPTRRIIETRREKNPQLHPSHNQTVFPTPPPKKTLGQPGNISALVLPSGGMTAKHWKGVTAERFTT